MADRMLTQDDPRTDRHRGVVYHAEDQVARVVASPHRRVRIGRQILTLPVDPPFGDLASMQLFVDEVLAGEAAQALWPAPAQPVAPVTVRASRGFRRATYHDHVISIPLADPRGRWAMTRAVLVHEVAHHLAGEPGHGPRFRAALVTLYRAHLGAAAAELLMVLLAPLEDLPELGVGAPAAAAGEHDQVRRVAALLAKAQSTSSPEEAEAYVAKAAEVAQRHSIDLAVAGMRPQGRPELPTHRMLTIGAPRAALNKHLVALYLAIARAWPVRVDIGPGSMYVVGYGMPADLDQVESVFATASALMVGGAQAHVRGRTWVGTTYQPGGAGARRPVTGTVARNAFVVGFVERVGARMAQAAQHAREAAQRSRGQDGVEVAGDPVSARSVEVALRAREVAVADYHRSASRARGSWQGSLTAAGSATASRMAGRRAADALGRRGLEGGRPALDR